MSDLPLHVDFQNFGQRPLRIVRMSVIVTEGDVRPVEQRSRALILPREIVRVEIGRAGYLTFGREFVEYPKAVESAVSSGTVSETEAQLMEPDFTLTILLVHSEAQAGAPEIETRYNVDSTAYRGISARTEYTYAIISPKDVGA